MSSSECGSGCDPGPEGGSVADLAARDPPRVLSVGEPAGVDRRYQGFEIGLPGQFGIQALQPLRCPQHERRRVAAPSQRERDLRSHPLRARFAEFAQRPDLSRYQ